MEKVIIAVDAGGTSTRINIIDKEKNILHNMVYDCGSPAVLGDEKKAFENIYEGVADTFRYSKNKYKIVAIIMGVSGVEVVEDREKYQKQFEDVFNTNIIIVNDAVLAVYSIITDLYDEGVLVLSGTGSAVLGIKNNKTRLFGGWGQLLTEVGSAYTTVRDFFISIIRNYESGNGLTELGKKFLSNLGYSRVEDLKFLVYPSTKKKIASYSKFINDEANLNKNEEAINLLKKGARDLATDVRNAYKGLNLSANTIIGFRGGFISNAPIVQSELIIALREYGINPQIVKGDEDPIYGAFYIAKRMGYLC